MTKGELIKALEPFDDEIEISRPLYNGDGEVCSDILISRVTYSYDVSNTTGNDGVGKIMLE